MNDWQLHWLEAEGDLSPYRSKIEAEIAAARGRLSEVVEPPRLDVVVQRLSGMVIPELGMTGSSFRKSLFAITVDPDNPNFAASLQDGAVQRVVVHEVHHCLRMAACGYGRSLGEALVSEGLAGQFVGHVLGTPPDPWECAVDEAEAAKYWPDAAALAATRYDHGAWFFGRDGSKPRWLGYTIGYRLVGKWLASNAISGAAWVTTPAAIVLEASAATTP